MTIHFIRYFHRRYPISEAGIPDYLQKPGNARLSVFNTQSLDPVIAIMNIAVLAFVILAAYQEWTAIKSGAAIDRLITSEVIMAVIGGTTVQFGAFVIAIARHQFPGDGD